MTTTSKNMNANQLINALINAEMRLGPCDTQNMIRAERMTLQVALSDGSTAKQIGEVMTEAKRVAEMWGVEL